jgi:hypothetical protein
MEEGFVLVSKYSRADAISDGTLVDVTAEARETGIDHPTALTREVWAEYVKLTPAAQHAGCDRRGRLHDILWMFRWAATASRSDESELRFELLVVTDTPEPKLVTLKAICGPGDDQAPVITILLPEQD